MKRILLYIICGVVAAATFTGCIEDGISTSPQHQPQPGIDTLNLGVVFTGEGTPTAHFKVYNRHDKIISIDKISLRPGESDANWRFNVDGISGSEFAGVEIRPNDSIFVFADVTLPDLRGNEGREYINHIDFTTRGVTQSVTLAVTGVDAERLRGVTLTEDATFTAERPYVIYDSLTVAEGATLTLEAGTKLHFHSDAFLTVDGTLQSKGLPGAEVEMTGDRMGTVVGRVDYEIMSGQWGGLWFSSTSAGNVMEYTSVRNTTWGVVVMNSQYTEATPALRMVNCQLRNSKDFVLSTYHTGVEAIGCELADASSGVVYMQGGNVLISNSTIANYYLFTAVGPALQFSHAWVDEEMNQDDADLPLLKADIRNSIIYGMGQDLSHGDLSGTEIYLRNCILRSEGSDDDNFIGCLWNADPLYYTVRTDYHFDYRVHPESPAIGVADPELTPEWLVDDRYGRLRTNGTLGAYEFDEGVEQEPIR